MAGKSPARSCEDIDETVLEFAEIKMLTCSDPRLKEKFELDNRLQQLTLEYNSWQQERLRLREFVDSVPKKLAQKEAEHQRVQLDVKQHTAFPEAKFSITIAGKSYSSRTEAGEAFFLLSSQTPIDGTLPLGTFHDFFLSSQRSALFNQLKILVKGHGMYSFDCSDSPLGTMIRLENLLSGLSQEEKKIGEEIAFLNQQKTDAQHQLEVLFHKADELSATRERKTRLDFELSHGKAVAELPSKTNWHLKRLELPPIPLTQQAALSPIRKNGLSL